MKKLLLLLIFGVCTGFLAFGQEAAVTLENECTDHPNKRTWVITNQTDAGGRFDLATDGGWVRSVWIGPGKTRSFTLNAVNAGYRFSVSLDGEELASLSAETPNVCEVAFPLELNIECAINPNQREWVITNPAENGSKVFVNYVLSEGEEVLERNIWVDAGESKSVTTHKKFGDVLTVNYGAQQSGSLTNSGVMCNIDGIELTSVCNNNPNKRKWRVRNPNGYRVWIEYGLYGSGERAAKVLPEAGEADEKWEGDGVFEYTFFYTDAQSGPNTLKIYYGDNQEKTKASCNCICPVPDGGVTVEPICSDKNTKNKWKVANNTNERIFITLDLNGNETSLAPAGKGQDENGNPQSGNFRFFYTSKSVTTFGFTYGAGQHIEAALEGAVCPLPDVNPCSVFYIDNAKNYIYAVSLENGEAVLTEYAPSPYGDAHMALNLDASRLYVFKSSGPVHPYGYYDTETLNYYPLGEVNVPGGIVQAAFDTYGTLFISSTTSDELFVFGNADDPSTLQSVGTITIAENGQKLNIAGADIAFDQDGTFYVSTHAHGGAIFSVSGMANHYVAKRVGTANSQGKITGLALLSNGTGDLIYSAKDATGMYVVNLTDPDNHQYVPFGNDLVVQSGWGDMTTACMAQLSVCENAYAASVIAFDQGTRKDGNRVEDRRSNPEMALGAPQEDDSNNAYNFVSLGFEGSLELELANPVYNHNKNGVFPGHQASEENAFGDGLSYADFIIVETSWGWMNTNCGADDTNNYPEKCIIYGKETLTEDWVLLTPESVCRTSFIDIGPAVESGQLEFVKYVKIVDQTDRSKHNVAGDGYDVDGLIICPDQVISAITGEGRDALVNARTSSMFNYFSTVPNEAETAELEMGIYPNPTKGNLRLTGAFDAPAKVEVIDLSGKLQLVQMVEGRTPEINLSGLKAGLYIVRISNSVMTKTYKLVKE